MVATPVGDTASLAEALAALRAQGRDGDRAGPAPEIVVAPWGGGNPAGLRAVVGDAHVAGIAGNANAARNAGAALATGDHLWFLDHRTRLRPGALALVSGVADRERDYRVIRAVGDRGPLATPSYLFSARHWLRAGLSFDEVHGEFPDATCARALLDRPVRVDGQLWDRVPAAGAADGAMPEWAGSLEAWLAMVPEVRRLVQGPDRARWIRDLLVHDLPGLLADAGRLPPTRLAELADTVGAVLASLEPHDLARVPVEARAGAWLAGQARWLDLERFLALRAERPGDFPTEIDGGTVRAYLPGVDWEALRVPPAMLEVGRDEARVSCSVRRVRWPVEDHGLTLAVDLFVGVRRVTLDEPVIRARWVSRDTAVDTLVTARPDPGIGLVLGGEHLDPTAGSVTARVPLSSLPAGTWALQVEVRVGDLTRTCQPEHRDRYGSAGELRPAPDGSAQPVWGATGLRLLVGARGAFESDRLRAPLLGRVEVTGDELVLHTGAPLTGPVELRSQRHVIVGEVDGERARFRLRVDRFGTGEAPAPAGRYRFLVGGLPVRWEPAASDDLALDLLADEHRVGVRRTPQGQALLLVGPPLHDDELGTHAQRVLRSSYDEAPLVDRVLLESAGGRECSGSPLAVDAELARARPELERWWVVTDHSVVVPPGARAVVKHSRPWHEALAGSRWVVTDGPLDVAFRRREGQHVVRLAGYPATTLAVARWRRLHFSRARIQRLVAGGADQWTTLVVPTEEAEADFRDMFGYRGEVLTTGLPGTDLLLAGDVAERRTATRERLGIRPDQVAVLHARHFGDRPTDGRRPVALLDPVELCDLLGDDHVVLLRTGGPPAGLDHPRLVDVSDHPRPDDLMLASDAAVVDYAALRFDYPLTGRPMVFHVPDQAVRAGDARGFLYPYAETTPGPVTTTTAQVAAHLHDLERLGRRQGQAMARFNARFNDHSDGRAAERVVAAVFGTGYGRLTLAPRLPADDETRPRMRVVRGRS